MRLRPQTQCHDNNCVKHPTLDCWQLMHFLGYIDVKYPTYKIPKCRITRSCLSSWYPCSFPVSFAPFWYVNYDVNHFVTYWPWSPKARFPKYYTLKSSKMTRTLGSGAVAVRCWGKWLHNGCLQFSWIFCMCNRLAAISNTYKASKPYFGSISPYIGFT